MEHFTNPWDVAPAFQPDSYHSALPNSTPGGAEVRGDGLVHPVHVLHLQLPKTLLITIIAGQPPLLGLITCLKTIARACGSLILKIVGLVPASNLCSLAACRCGFRCSGSLPTSHEVITLLAFTHCLCCGTVRPVMLPRGRPPAGAMLTASTLCTCWHSCTACSAGVSASPCFCVEAGLLLLLLL